MPLNLVTGGAGFIGSNLVRALLQNGEEVRVLDNFSSGRRENLGELGNHVHVIEGDLRDYDAVNAAVAGVERIFHLAAMVSVPESMSNIQGCIDINERGTINLFEAARAAGVQRVVLSSSCAVYGDSQDLPLKETTPIQPLSPYAVSKRQNEIYGALYTRAFDLEVAALRYFNVFGPRQRPDSAYAAAIPIFISRILKGLPPTIYGDGSQKRDFVYVSDIVEANLLASKAPQAAGKVFNVCTGQAVSILELTEILTELLPDAQPVQFAAPRAGDIHLSWGNPSYTFETLGFSAKTSLTDGLAKTIQWMKGS